MAPGERYQTHHLDCKPGNRSGLNTVLLSVTLSNDVKIKIIGALMSTNKNMPNDSERNYASSVWKTGK